MQIALFHPSVIDEQLIREIQQSHAVQSVKPKTAKTTVLELSDILHPEQRAQLRHLGALHTPTSLP